MIGEANRRAAMLVALSSALGVVVTLLFVGFEEVMQRGQDFVWVTIAGDDPGAWVTIAIATVGGLAMGLGLRFLPGHGGPHPADGHGLLGGTADHRPPVVVGVLVVGLVGLIAGASLGPEGAIIPAAAGLSVLFARVARVQGPALQLVQAAGLSALLAAMFGSPLAGVVPLMEMAPAGVPMTVMVLPALAASATAAITLRVLDVEAVGHIPFTYDTFHAPQLLWAVVLGVVAGGAGVLLRAAVAALRPLTRRIDARSVVLTGTIGGAVLGVLFVIGGESIRFAGIPELLPVLVTTDTARHAIFLAAMKLLATAWCIAVGYRGGMIFPAAFVGGAVGLALHLMVHSIPLEVAVAVGIAAAIATALRSPVTASLIAAAVVTPALLPLAILGVVTAHVVHLIGEQGMSAVRPKPEQPAIAD
ncbi:MAG: chloride channel protein [Actinobacteria bacterium]|nr:chloride channel protein [Actinomycetota bacterium]